jgi:hypothetical protein
MGGSFITSDRQSRKLFVITEESQSNVGGGAPSMSVNDKQHHLVMSHSNRHGTNESANRPSLISL